MENEKQISPLEKRVENYDSTQPNPRQQIKLIKYLMSSNLADFKVSKQELNEDNYNSYVTAFDTLFAKGDMNENKLVPLLLKIETPMTKLNGESEAAHDSIRNNIFLDYMDNDRAMQTVAILSRGEVSSFEKLNSFDLDVAYEKYPTAVDFHEELESELFGNLLYKHNDNTKDLYKVAVNEIAQAMYGKQNEYYNQFTILKESAIEKLSV